MATGNANKMIADKGVISEETVKARMKSILSKLGANDRCHAVTIAARPGFSTWDDGSGIGIVSSSFSFK